MRYQVRHLTEYLYDKAVIKGFNRAHILPLSGPTQTRLALDLHLDPEPSWRSINCDCYGNEFLYFILTQAHQSLKIEVSSELHLSSDQSLFTPVDRLTIGESLRHFQKQQRFDPQMTEFLSDSGFIAASAALAELGRPLFADPHRSFLQALQQLNQHIFTTFAYDSGFSTINTPLDEVLQHRRGVCQDFAHLGIGVLRSLGIPARYVSGYLETLPPPGQEKLIGADASHAWFEVLIPDQGWFGFDPTNNTLAAEQHIITARGRDYGDVPPLQGVFFGDCGQQQMRVSVDVRRLD